MAGGAGTRFWPWSRGERPKQLLALTGAATMLADTAERVRKLVPPENILIVTGSKLRKGVAESVPWIPRECILCEPEGRNTAACVGWAAHEVEARDPDGVMVVLPADHVVEPMSAFTQAMHEALALADRDRRLVTFGIPPTEPATGYGYIRAGKKISSESGVTGASEVAAFHEKPTEARARRFVASGNYFWNSGMFAWRGDVIREEIEEHLPGLATGLARMEKSRRRGRISQASVDRAYPKLDSISIDHGVMEKSKRVAMLAAPFSWNDIGSWDAVGSVWPSDRDGNRSRDEVFAVDSQDNIVATDGKPVALLGVSGLAVVDAGDALLVCPRDRAQDVRRIVDILKRARRNDLL